VERRNSKERIQIRKTYATGMKLAAIFVSSISTSVLTQYYFVHQIEKNEVGGQCSTYGERKDEKQCLGGEI